MLTRSVLPDDCVVQKLRESLYGCARQQRSARGSLLFQAPQTRTYHHCVQQCASPDKPPLVLRDKFAAALSAHDVFALGGAAAVEAEMLAGERDGAVVRISGSPSGVAGDILCVDVPWLSHLLQRTLGCPCETDPDGCVSAEDLVEAARRCLPDGVEANIAIANIQQLVSLGLVVPLQGGRCLVPGHSSPQPPPVFPLLFQPSRDILVYRRRYVLGGVPTGLWDLLIGRLLVSSSTAYQASVGRNFDNDTAAALLLSICQELPQQLQGANSMAGV